MTPADLDLAAALRTLLRHPLVREEIRAIVAEEASPARPAGDELLTTAQIAEQLGVQPEAVLEHITKGRLEAFRPPGLRGWRVKRTALEAFLAGSSGPTPPLRLDEHRARAKRLADSVKGRRP